MLKVIFWLYFIVIRLNCDININTIKSEKLADRPIEVSTIPSIYNIPHEQQDEILNNISVLIDEDIEINQSRRVESIKAAEEFVPRSNP